MVNKHRIVKHIELKHRIAHKKEKKQRTFFYFKNTLTFYHFAILDFGELRWTP